MRRNKHQIYFDKVDFLQILRKYEDSEASSYSQQQLLLVAKGYFIQQLYAQCVSLLKTISHNNKAKILFEKQTLLFKASYLLDPHNTDQLKTIIEQFQYSQRFVTDKPLSPYHHNVFKQFRSFLQSQKVKSSSFIQEIPQSEQHINQRKNQGDQIISMQKRLQKLPKIQGFPCFLVQKNWRRLQLNFYKNKKNVKKVKNKDSNIAYVTQQPIYPGPITNFTIINHIFEVIPYQTKSSSFLNIILFPGQEFQIVSKPHWQYLNQTYGGIPVRRTFQALPVTRFSNEITYNQKMTVRLQINYLNNLEILQVPSTSLWSYNVIPILWKRYGLGHLKQQYSQNNYKIVGQGKVFQPQSQKPLKFVTFQNHNVYNQTADDLKFQKKMFLRYNFEKYSIEHSPSKGLVGLTNDKFLCFMNSSLQCLSNNYDLSKFFLQNQYIQFLNFSKNNDLGSRGQITCAYADIIKQIWNLNCQSQRDAQINPNIFKEVFAKRFQNFVDDSQEDAHEFLNFLLNCMHDDLNMNFKVGPNKVLKTIKDSTNFDQVRKTYTENYESNNRSEITELFKGYTYSTLKCLNCEAKYYNFDMHLTFPLPVPAANSSISVHFISYQRDGQSIRYNIFLEDIKNVGDLIKKIQSKQNNLSPTRAAKYKIAQQKQFYMLGVHKQTFKVQNYYSPEIQIQKLLNNQGKYIFILYYLSKEKNKNGGTQDRMIDVQIDSSQQHTESASQKLFLVQYYFEDQRKGYPKLIYLDTNIPDERILQIAAENLPDQALKYSGGVATQKQKLDCIEKVKIDKVKGKPFQTILKVKLAKDLSLFQQKEKVESIGELSQISQFTLESCFNIFQQKDKINEEQGWVCGKCKKISSCQKQEKIYSVGSHLIIVLKRFKEGEKINTKIQYPIQNLDISKYIDENFKSLNPAMKFIYDLYGVIIHRGNLNRGHYYSYCKNKLTDKWYLFDDQLVREQSNPQFVVSENAYVLFYRIKEE